MTWSAVAATFALVLSLVAASPSLASAASPEGLAASTIADSATVDAGMVKAAAVVGFNPENIISDALFYDGNAMSSAEIQSFLDSKIGACRNGKCLNVLTAGISSRDAVYSQTTGNLICSAIQGGSMKVSELIYRVQAACGISAKVILVTLQKEQGLTTSKEPSDWNLKAAMGASCPDTAPCDPAFAGVGPQILKGTQQLKTYKAANFAKQPGVNWIGYNPNTPCGGTNLNIQNYATAALYNYTPYQPNAAALAAGYGLGDGCSSYGNRNFYNYYTDWFGSTQGGSSSDDPVGFVDNVSSSPGEIYIAGWALDPNSAAPIDVHVYVDGAARSVRADASRPDLAAHYPGLGTNHGYAVTVPAPQWGDVDVCVYGINVLGGSNRLLGCQRVTSYGGSPIGYLDGVVPGPGSVTVAGWALDPDTVEAIRVHVYVGANATSITADTRRSDVGSLYPAYGVNHGFMADVPAPAGFQTVCVYGINVKTGGNVLLGDCRQVFVKAASDPATVPTGSVDSVTVQGDFVTVRGWALDPDTPDPIAVHSYVGTVGSAHRAEEQRPDVARAYPGYGSAHGFTVARKLPPGGGTVCVYAINDGKGSNYLIGCYFASPQPSDPPFGAVDAITVMGQTVTISGWAIDPDSTAATAVHVYVAGAGTATVADAVRADVGAAYPNYGANHGFRVQRALPPDGGEVCVYAINDGTGPNTLFTCRTVHPNQSDPFGSLDGVSLGNGRVDVSGWAIDPDTDAALAVHIYVDGVGRALTADGVRRDVATAYPGKGANHGFSASIPVSRASTVCAYAINVGPGSNTLLGCRTL